MMDALIENYPTILALLGGVIVHIAKKAGQLFQAAQKDSSLPRFSLKDYFMGHPYQTFMSFASAAGLYFGLMQGDALTLSSAFLAGVAANSLGDIAKGDRG